jgi:WD40 repeat protein
MAELIAAVPALTGDRGRSPAAATLIGELVNPFKALRAFGEADAADFHGRDRLVARFVDVLARPGSAGRLLAVVGPSGSGKSSAVRSGLLPRLRAGAVTGSQDWFITTMLPGAHPFDELEAALARVAVHQVGALSELMRDDPRGIARAINLALPDEDSELLLVIDQFEELFTHVGDGERTRFLDRLIGAMREPRARLRVAITIRADFLDRPLRHPQLAARLETATVTVSPLTADELEAAIVEPVRRQGATYEPGLVARIIGDVGDQPGALPLLQYALTELFDANVSGLIRTESYDAIGGLTGALSSRADETLTTMSADRQRAARRLFGRLVTLGEGTEDTRRRVRVSELGGDPDVEAVVETFGAARLLVFDRDPATREPTVEIAHEALLRAWPRLRGWLDEDRDDLRTLRGIGAATDAWLASDRDQGELARGGRLETVTELATRRADLLNTAEAEWVATSRTTAAAEEAARDASAARDRHQNRRLRQLLVAAAVLVVVALVAAGGALVLRNRAVDSEQQANESRAAAVAAEQRAVDAKGQADANAEQARAAQTEAEQARTDAESNAAQAVAAREDADVQRLTALSASKIAVDPDLAILLALEANRRRDDLGTQSALQRAIATNPMITDIFPNRLGEGERVEFSIDGSVAVAHTIAAGTGRLQWFDPRTGTTVGSDYVSAAGIQLAAVSGDGSVAAIAFDDGTVRFVDQRGEEVAAPYEPDEPPLALALDRSGVRLLVVEDTTSVVVDVGSGADISTYESTRPPLQGEWTKVEAALSADGTYFVVELYDDRTDPVVAGYDVVDAATGARREQVEAAAQDVSSNFFGFTMEVTSLFLADDGRIVTGYADGRVEVRAVGGDSPPLVLRGPLGAVVAVGLATDGSIAAAAADGAIHLWSATGAVAAAPFSIGGEVGAIAFGADDTIDIALKGAGHAVLAQSTSVLVDQRWPSTRSFDVSQFHDDYLIASEGLSTLQLRSLADDSLVFERPVADLFPDGLGYGPLFSSDGDWMMTGNGGERVVISEVHGDRRFVVDGDAAYRQKFGRPLPDYQGGAIRPGTGGDRVFFTYTPVGGKPFAMWVDSATSTIVAGPMEFGDLGGPPLVLADGRVVVASLDTQMTILPADLQGAPVVVDGGDGFRAYDVDPATGRVLIGSLDGRVGVLDLDSASIQILATVSTQPHNAAFSPDGERAAFLLGTLSSSQSAGVQLLDLETGQLIGVPMSLPGTFVRTGTVSWAADGTGAWVGTEGGPTRFASDPAEWRSIACGIVHRALTADEWRTLVSDSEPQVSACP